MQRESREPTDADLADATAYLMDGGLGETYGLAVLSWSMGRPKVQMDTDMALALLRIAMGKGGMSHDH